MADIAISARVELDRESIDMARQNDHTRAEDLMSAYLDQQITAREKLFLEQHLAVCADCRARLETTRLMIAALKALPAVKAPRSFVLPRDMAKQPRRSVFTWYPALRFATVIAALALAILFSSDLLINRSGSGTRGLASIPAAAPAPQVMLNQAPAAPTTEAAASSAEAPAQAQAAAPLATAPAAPAESSMVGGAAAKATANDSTTLSAATATPVTPKATPTPKATAIALAEATHASTARSASTTEAARPPAPAIDPWRVAEIALLGVVIALGVATLIARRRS